MTQNDALASLNRALVQLSDLLEHVRDRASDDPTPCTGWNLSDLVDHVVAAPARFARMLRHEAIDWAAPTPPAGADPAGALRANAQELMRAWQEVDDSEATAGADWQCAEFAVHTWDLATALHLSTGEFDQEVAERGLAFMHANLTSDNRGPAFGPAQPAPDDADAYQRIAAFAGRSIRDQPFESPSA
jgi:uncharacterized protein (TIGR03086 family)